MKATHHGASPDTEESAVAPAMSDRALAVCRRTLALIPALDEAATLPSVLESLSQWPLAGVRVVDNGSRDDTVALARAAEAEVIEEPVRGYGSACWRGLQNLPDEIDWIFFCDADGSDDLSALEPFFAAAADGCDLILGNRNALSESRRALTPPQRFGNAFAGWIIELAWGMRFHDLGPLRLIRRTSLEALQMEDRGFGWTVEMQAKAAGQQLKCREIPVHYAPRRGGRSKISGSIRGTLCAGTIILTTLGKLWRREK